MCACLFVCVVLVLFESDAIVEGLGAFVAFGDKVEADTTDVLFGTEGLGIVNLFALNFEFHQPPVLETHTIAIAQMAVDNLGHTHQDTDDIAFAESRTLGRFLDNLFTLDGLVVNGYGLVFAKSSELRLGLFLDSVSHKRIILMILSLQRYIIFERIIQIQSKNICFLRFLVDLLLYDFLLFFYLFLNMPTCIHKNDLIY